MNWIVYALAILAGLVVLVIFALQVFHSIAEYHERAGKQGARERLPLSKKPAASEESNGTDRGAGETRPKSRWRDPSLEDLHRKPVIEHQTLN